MCFVNAKYPKNKFVFACLVHNVHSVTVFIFVFQKYICILIFIKKIHVYKLNQKYIFIF